MSTVASSVGKFVWHVQVSSDPRQAQSFYTQLFGRDTEVFNPGEVDYTMISAGGQSQVGRMAIIADPPGRQLSLTATSTAPPLAYSTAWVERR